MPVVPAIADPERARPARGSATAGRFAMRGQVRAGLAASVGRAVTAAPAIRDPATVKALLVLGVPRLAAASASGATRPAKLADRGQTDLAR